MMRQQLQDGHQARWRGDPKTKAQAEAWLTGKHCPICHSKLLVPLTREPVPTWRVHCNNCGMEVNLAVLINLPAWQAAA